MAAPRRAIFGRREARVLCVTWFPLVLPPDPSGVDVNDERHTSRWDDGVKGTSTGAGWEAAIGDHLAVSESDRRASSCVRLDGIENPLTVRLRPDHPRRDEILARHASAMQVGRTTYADPLTGFTVFTARFLADRGWCCESGCRHCPFEPASLVDVPPVDSSIAVRPSATHVGTTSGDTTDPTVGCD